MFSEQYDHIAVATPIRFIKCRSTIVTILLVDFGGSPIIKKQLCNIEVSTANRTHERCFTIFVDGIDSSTSSNEKFSYFKMIAERCVHKIIAVVNAHSVIQEPFETVDLACTRCARKGSETYIVPRSYFGSVFNK